MSVQACDQMAYDLLEASRLTQKRHGNCYKPDIRRLHRLVGLVEILRPKRSTLRTTVQSVVRLQGLSPAEDELYQRALRRVFGRRFGEKKRERLAFEAAVDFPRGQDA